MCFCVPYFLCLCLSFSMSSCLLSFFCRFILFQCFDFFSIQRLSLISFLFFLNSFSIVLFWEIFFWQRLSLSVLLFDFILRGECRCSSCSSVLYSRDFSFCFLFFGLMCGGKGLFYVRGCGFYCICHALRLSWTKKWKKNTVKQYTRSSSIYLTFVLHSIIFNLVSFAISGGKHVNLPLAWRMM